jgi:hypothetical protein
MQLRRIIDSAVGRLWIGLQWVLRQEFTRELLALYVVGLLVAGIVFFLLLIPYVENIDRYLTDALMRQVAQQERRRLKAEKPELPFVYINVGQTTCERWAAHRGTSCTLGVTTSRDGLSALLEKIKKSIDDKTGEPRLVVIDIELAPLPHEQGGGGASSSHEEASDKTAATTKDELEPADCHLRKAVFDLADAVPLLAMRPMVIDPKRAPYVFGFQSILDGDVCKESNSAPAQKLSGKFPEKLWFASAVIQADSDGVIRSVHACDTMQLMRRVPKQETFESIREPVAIAGIGLLGAVLLHYPVEETPRVDFEKTVSGFFDGSRPNFDGSRPDTIEPGRERNQKCPGMPIAVDGRNYGRQTPATPGRRLVNRIMFSLPFDQLGQAAPVNTVEATDFNPQDYSSQLDKAVVVIGGSYLASGDLRTTPLGPGMPGAVVHANAISAYYTKELIEEGHSWVVELTLIGIAALIGALFHVISSRGTDALCILGSWIGLVVAPLVIWGFQAEWVSKKFVFGMLVGVVLAAFLTIFIPRILVSLVGAAVAASLVLWFGVRLAYPILVAGTAIGTLTPALAVAFEGLFNVLHSIKELVARCVDWVAPSSRPPDRMTIDAVVAIAMTDEPPSASRK